MAYHMYEEIFKHFSTKQAQALIFAFEGLQRKILSTQIQGVEMAYNIYENILNQFSSEQAQALIYTLELFQRKISESHTEEVIFKTRNSLSNEFATKSDLEKSILEAKLELKEDIANVRNELKEDIANVRNELKEDIANVRNEVFNVKTELKAVEIDILKWVGAGFVATITITLTGVGFMIRFL